MAATATHPTKSITTDFQKYKEKENRRPESLLHVHHLSTNSGSSGSLPKRYQSVVTNGTPLASFGVRNGDNQLRSHSPTNPIQPQLHKRPLKPVREFLTTPPIVDQHIDDRRRVSSHTNAYSRAQTEATVHNVNVALTKTLNKLRQEPLNTASANGRSTPFYAGPQSSRPMTSRATSHPYTNTATTSNFHYQLPGGTKGPLPAELITRRPTSSFGSNNVLNGTSHNRVSSGPGPLIVQQQQQQQQQQPTTSIRNEMRSTDTASGRAAAPFRAPAKSLDTGLHQTNGFNLNSVPGDEYHHKLKKSKYESNQQLTTKSTSYKQSPLPRTSNADHQHRSLPEVSVNPHIQSSVQSHGEQTSQSYEPFQNDSYNNQIHSQTHENHSISTVNTTEKYTNHHHHHIQVEPINTFKRTSSPTRHQQIMDVQPNIIVQHQRSTLGPNSSTNTALLSTKDPLNEAYIERDNTGVQSLTTMDTQTNNDNDSTSTLKQYDTDHERKTNTVTPPPSPATQELNRIWKKQRNKYPLRSMAAILTGRRSSKTNRPPGRLKNYEDESGSETTATETQSKDDDMARRHCLPPSDLGSDVWSDLTSEFSDTKFRKHPNIRTSTPNMTRQSSSQSSKEVGQIRKQLSDLQIMYNDLLKLLDIDIESMRSSHKSSTSSPADHSSRRHRFRKVMPVNSIRPSNIDMREVNQRFTRLETSIVTLAESIAKLSAQVQAQRAIKDDIYHLRQEVAELRQQIHYQTPRQQSSTSASTTNLPSATAQQPTRLITPNVQRRATVNTTNPLNASTSYMPSISTVQRANSIIDPRQARKIEQFFGTEAMLRYFLSLLNYEEYASILEREKIGIYELPYVSERKLQSLGIPYGPCARIIYEAQQYFISLLTLKSSGIDV